MALLASTVALSARGLVGGATSDDILGQIESLDTSARRHARQSGMAVQMQLDTTTGQVTLTESGQSDASPLGGYALPKGYELKDAWRMRRGERVLQPQLILTYDPNGVTSTWGVTLSPPGTPGSEQPATETKALLVLGLTGQTTQWESDEQVRDILAQTQRRDAD